MESKIKKKKLKQSSIKKQIQTSFLTSNRIKSSESEIVSNYCLNKIILNAFSIIYTNYLENNSIINNYIHSYNYLIFNKTIQSYYFEYDSTNVQKQYNPTIEYIHPPSNCQIDSYSSGMIKIQYDRLYKYLNNNCQEDKKKKSKIRLPKLSELNRKNKTILNTIDEKDNIIAPVENEIIVPQVVTPIEYNMGFFSLADPPKEDSEQDINLLRRMKLYDEEVKEREKKKQFQYKLIKSNVNTIKNGNIQNEIVDGSKITFNSIGEIILIKAPIIKEGSHQLNVKYDIINRDIKENHFKFPNTLEQNMNHNKSKPSSPFFKQVTNHKLKKNDKPNSTIHNIEKYIPIGSNFNSIIPEVGTKIYDHEKFKEGDRNMFIKYGKQSEQDYKKRLLEKSIDYSQSYVIYSNKEKESIDKSRETHNIDYERVSNISSINKETIKNTNTSIKYRQLSNQHNKIHIKNKLYNTIFRYDNDNQSQYNKSNNYSYIIKNK